MSSKPARSFGVTLIALLVLTIASLNLLRLIFSLQQREFLGSLPGVSPLYQAFTGLIWASTALVLFWGLWRKKRWAPKAVSGGALCYAVYYWLDRLLLTDWLRSHRAPANLVFASGATLVVLGYIFWTLSRPKIKVIFGETHERSS